MSIIRVSELDNTTGLTSGSLIMTAYGDDTTKVSKKITVENMLSSEPFGRFYQPMVPMGDRTVTLGLSKNVGTIDALYLGNSGLTIGDTTIHNNVDGLHIDNSVDITGSLIISDPEYGILNDRALVIDSVTNVVKSMPQGLRTSYGLFSQITDSTIISGTTNESSIIGTGVGSLIIPANGFTVGDSFKADLGGVLSAQNNDTIRIRVKAANTGMLLGDSGVQTLSNVTNNVWTLSLNFIIRAVGIAGAASIGTIGRFSYNKTTNGAIEGFAFNTVNNTTFDTTIQTEMIITVQFGTSSNNNIIFSDMFTLNKIY